MIHIDIQAVKSYLQELQIRLCKDLSQIDGKVDFLSDQWQSALSIGNTCVIQNGAVFEKGAVNFSFVESGILPASATLKRPELTGSTFQAAGISLIMHPNNPYVPTVHMNLRFFLTHKKDQTPVWWFGGGYDLTPYYGFAEDCYHWHHTAKQACDAFGKEFYPEYKKNCDEYFYLKHRQEPRGIGGLFFDDLNEGGFEQCFAMVKKIGDSFIKAYLPIVEKRQAIAFGEREKSFQRYRRGRYVEFNLIYDRGTLFGLQSGGRTESILCSMPPEVSWSYNWHPEANSAEEALYKEFLIRKDWV